MMRPVSLNDYLGVDNRWTKRLLGLETFKVERTPAKVTQEYDREKWGPLLDRELRDVHHAKAVEREVLLGPEWRTVETPMSLKNELFITNQPMWLLLLSGMVRERLKNYKAAYYCELGCGYGYNLTLVDGPSYGGEFTEAGVAVARKLRLDVSRFDFYDRTSYGLIRPQSVVFTVQALEQIPDATSFLEGLRSQRDRVACVLHFEPSILPGRRDLLGLLRNRYLELNDYNRNLVTLLRQAPDVEVLELEEDCIGSPPLNSLHFIAWRFK